ncbi:oxygen-insensitive NADPH nitroreductase [Lentibacillus salinarum]|uniref:Oxygen-insensitive NADPH nitroreductase n=1 Tax=Lentibacillus salinarum TaxID=446820 RepID=A0ABW3ZQ20_9BACI
MNNTLQTIFNHRSIRKFTKEKLTTEQIYTIVRGAQKASTSNYMMAYTIIGIDDEETKEKLATITGQTYVKDNGHFFIFCADLHRVYNQASKTVQEKMQVNMENTEQFIVATVDTALAAQNAAIAAESIGLGVCFIGSIRNDIKRVDEILQLPQYVIPLFGLAVGYPDQKPEQKPRLPLDVVYHENKYDHNLEQIKRLISEFDQQIRSYYQKRSTNTRTNTWTEQMIRKYCEEVRMDITQFVKDKGYNKH